MVFPSLFLAIVSGWAAAEPIFGGSTSRSTFAGFLKVWRGTYKENDGSVPELPDAMLPAALRGVKTKIVLSSGGAAGGVVTEGMGYGIMIEGFQASARDVTALSNGLSLVKGWLAMVYGPNTTEHPFGGGNGSSSSATQVDSWPYGVSAINSSAEGMIPAGVASWKFPPSQCYPICQGSATDGDEDAVLGMIHLAAALDYPTDFVDMVMRGVIAFASADLGFPDLHRTLGDGTRAFLPKGGSQWGGLLPPSGKYSSAQQAWCYNPSYFAPGHYRSFRDFARAHWRPAFDAYLPPRLGGAPTSLADLVLALNGAVNAGYNMLYRSSCPSGTVANWVGAKAECASDDTLSCDGVPWATTPYVGERGTCTASGTAFGAWGADASRTPWRIAVDYALHGEESLKVVMYDERGHMDVGTVFNAQVFLNRIARQYTQFARCNGGKEGDCSEMNHTSPAKLAPAFSDAPNLKCRNVPFSGEGWWAAFMSWPTFTAFVAPFASIGAQESSQWLDTFAGICDFSSGSPSGNICFETYFEAGQEVISSMIMAGAVKPVPSSAEAVVVI